MSASLDHIWPPDWQERPDYLKLRIARLKRASRFCRGRAADLLPQNEQEITRLEELLRNLEDRNVRSVAAF